MIKTPLVTNCRLLAGAMPVLVHFGLALIFTLPAPVRADEVRSTATLPSESTPSRPVRTEAFALVGTGTYPGGSIAVFDGNQSEFKTCVHTGETLGDCTVTAIAFDHVRLQTPGGEVELPMEKQLRRENSGSWQLADLTAPFTRREDPPAQESLPAARAASVRVAAPSSQFKPAREGNEQSAEELQKLDKVDKKLFEAAKVGEDFEKFISGQVTKPSKRLAKALRGAL